MTDNIAPSNEKQAAYWNEAAGPKWVRVAAVMDARFAAITELLIGRSAPVPGARVLDVGCGTGTTVLALADVVGPAGLVTGVDVSEPMLGVARAAVGDAKNIVLLQADAQVHEFEPATFDLICSRFGVMFFGDPVAAFANLRRALRPEGGLCFVCWAPLAENPHWAIPFDIAAAALGAPAPRPAHAPGPMAFSDPAYLEEILKSAGYTKITIAPKPVTILGETLAAEADIACFLGPAGALLDEKQATAETRARLRAEISAAITPFEQDGGVSLPGTVYLVEAKG
jgi:SAM-dependent methyltransferase